MEKDKCIHHVTSNGSVEREKSVSFQVKSVPVLLFVLFELRFQVSSLFIIKNYWRLKV